MKQPAMPRQSFTPDDPALPMNYPGFVYRMLRDGGHPAEALLAGTGLEETRLSDPDFRCGFQPLRRFFLNAIEQTGNPDLGIEMGLRFQPPHIGIPAYTAMNAARFRDGLDVLTRFFFLNFPAFDLHLMETETGLHAGEAAIRLRSKFPFDDLDYFGFGSALVAINGLLNAMLRTDRVVTRAEMTVTTPAGWQALEARIGFPIRFGAAENRIVFPRALLDRPLPGADPINHAQLLKLCAQCAEDRAFETTPVTRLVSVLEGAPSLTVSLAEVARELGCSERGLRRQLDRSGTSYRMLLDQVRERRARALLSGTTQPIKAIAGTLGYESSSNFARSFKRLTGLSPKAYRERAQGSEAPGRK